MISSALYPLLFSRLRVPTGDISCRVEHENAIILDRFHEQSEGVGVGVVQRAYENRFFRRFFVHLDLGCQEHQATSIRSSKAKRRVIATDNLER